jgi:hypothetical protein
MSITGTVLASFERGEGGSRSTYPPCPDQANFEINKYLKDDLGDRPAGDPGRQIVDEAMGFLQERKAKNDARPFSCIWRLATRTIRGWRPSAISICTIALPCRCQRIICQCTVR